MHLCFILWYPLPAIASTCLAEFAGDFAADTTLRPSLIPQTFVPLFEVVSGVDVALVVGGGGVDFDDRPMECITCRQLFSSGQAGNSV